MRRLIRWTSTDKPGAARAISGGSVFYAGQDGQFRRSPTCRRACPRGYAAGDPNTGCQLAASLLALDLAHARETAEYVQGRYSANPDQQHWWVEVRGGLLDPTRDQFGEDPLTEAYEGFYTPESRKRKTGGDIEDEAYMLLRLSWSYNRPIREIVVDVAREYGLNIDRVEEFLLLSG